MRQIEKHKDSFYQEALLLKEISFRFLTALLNFTDFSIITLHSNMFLFLLIVILFLFNFSILMCTHTNSLGGSDLFALPDRFAILCDILASLSTLALLLKMLGIYLAYSSLFSSVFVQGKL